MTLSTAEENLLLRVGVGRRELEAGKGMRDDAIRAAAAEGVALSKIASAAGLSKARVHQIVHAA